MPLKFIRREREKILDVGCGWGNISISLMKRKFDVIGIDYSRKSIAICQHAAKRFGFSTSNFICRDATDTGFPKETFDVVYCCDLVEHLYPNVYTQLLREVNRILKKGGKFIVYTPNPGHIFEILKNRNIILKKDISHVDYKTMKRLKKSLIDNGFTIEKAFYIESHIPVFNILEKSLMWALPFLRRRNAVLAVKK